MKYRPERYIVKIKELGKEPEGWGNEDDVYFDSWQEAHDWLIADRELKLRRAREAFKSAARALKKAQTLQKPGFSGVSPRNGPEYEAFEDRKHPQDWRVEASDEDGGCYVAIFSGPEAKQRAEEYAAWKSERG